MDEFPQHSQIQLRLVFEDVIISPDFAASEPRLDLDDVLEMPLIKGLAVLKRDLRRHFAPPSLDLDEAADVSLVMLHSFGASASRNSAPPELHADGGGESLAADFDHGRSV